MYMENSTDVGKAMEADFMKRAEHLSPEERINGFNVNMAKDGQLSHNAVELTKDIMTGRWDDTSRIVKPRRWLVGNYVSRRALLSCMMLTGFPSPFQEAGDVVFHNPYMIHGAIKNEDPLGRIRLSTDLRFYKEGSDLDQRWMRDTWRPDDGL